MTKETFIKNVKIYFLLLLILFSAVLLLFLSDQYSAPDLSLTTERAVPFSTPWYYTEEGIARELSLPSHPSTPVDTDFTISNVLPSDLVEGSSICIRSSCQSIRILLDGEQIYERGTDSASSVGKVIGSNWNIIRIPRGNAGKQIDIVLRSPYQDFSTAVNEIVYGSKSSTLFWIIEQLGFGFLITVIVFLLSLVLLLLSLYMRIRKLSSRGVFYLSLFTLLFSFWLLSESKLLQFFTGNQIYVTLFSFFGLLLFPLPFLLYTDYIYQSRHKTYLSVLFWLYSGNFILNVVLQLLNLRDFYENLPFTHILLGIGMAAIVADCCYESIKHKNKEAFHFLRSLSIFFLFAVMEFISYYLKSYSSVSKYLRIGFLIFILLLTIDAVNKIQKMAASKREAEYFEKLAYTDLLTMGKNRTAYTKEVDRLTSEKKLCGIGMAVFDVNNLKQINDTYGHAQGDDAIHDAFGCMKESFGRIGTCYRIGGGEFACLIEKADLTVMEQLAKEFNAAVYALNTTKKYEFEIALGFDIYDMNLYEDNFDAFYIHVDNKMYQNKELLKK